MLVKIIKLIIIGWNGEQPQLWRQCIVSKQDKNSGAVKLSQLQWLGLVEVGKHDVK